MFSVLEECNRQLIALAIFLIIHNFGSFTKAIRNAFTHLAEELNLFYIIKSVV